MARPTVNVFDLEGKVASSGIALPSVMTAPIRSDIVRFVHSMVSMNRRQAHAVNIDAGQQTSAESWGTGRAVARIPRVGGGGTSRSGQGAFGNMCRGGRMFQPVKVWRRWHRKTNRTQRRFATVSALAASAVTSLVMARGHHIDEIAEIPLVVDDAIQSITKTRVLVQALNALKANGDLARCKESTRIRSGHGKYRNRRYFTARGPLVVVSKDEGVSKAAKNIPGVDTCVVDNLSVLQLAPGGHFGRFVIFTKSAFTRLEALWGSNAVPSTLKKEYKAPRSICANPDFHAIVTSEKVLAALRVAKAGGKKIARRNLLNNKAANAAINPFFASAEGKAASAKLKATRNTKIEFPKHSELFTFADQ